jgi:hypothetical protein
MRKRHGTEAKNDRAPILRVAGGGIRRGDQRLKNTNGYAGSPEHRASRRPHLGAVVQKAGRR